MTSDRRPPTSETPAIAFEIGAIFRRLGPAGPVAIASVVLPFIGSLTLYSLLYWAGPWLKAQGTLGVELYIAGFIILGGVGILPTHPALILGGYAFGFKTAALFAAVSITLASLFAFVFTQLTAKSRVTELIAEHPKWAAVYRALVRSGMLRTLGIVLLIRAPSTPFALTNFVLAATRVPLVVYVIGTVVGMAPRACLLLYLGSRMKTLDLREAGGWWALGLWFVVGLIGLTIISLIARHAIQHMTSESSDAAPPSSG